MGWKRLAARGAAVIAVFGHVAVQAAPATTLFKAEPIGSVRRQVEPADCWGCWPRYALHIRAPTDRPRAQSLTSMSIAIRFAEAAFKRCYVCTYRGATTLPVQMLRPSTLLESKVEAEKICRIAATSMKQDPNSCTYVGCTMSTCPRLGGPALADDEPPFGQYAKPPFQESAICRRYGFAC
jgi:hypothetical protein